MPDGVYHLEMAKDGDNLDATAGLDGSNVRAARDSIELSLEVTVA